MADKVTERVAGGRRRIYLVRHGDVDYFDERGRPHRPDLVPLNETGRRQVAALAEVLAPVPVDRVVASDLPRAVETARALALRRGLEVETRAELREIRPGRLADVPAAAIESLFTGAFAGVDRSTTFLGGERFGDLVDRVLPCYRSLLADESWKSIAIVAHGGVNRAILLDVLGRGLAGFGAIEQDPAALNIVDVHPDGSGIVRLLNATTYAPAKEGMLLTTMEKLFLEKWGHS